MKTKAAVVSEPGKRLEIEELDLDGPQAGEVLITRTYTLNQVNEGCDDLLAGQNVRGVVVHEH